jgi:hypothetical protein
MDGMREPVVFGGPDRASVQRNLLRDAALDELRLVLDLGGGLVHVSLLWSERRMRSLTTIQTERSKPDLKAA